MPKLKVYIVEDSPYVRNSLLRAIKDISGVEVIGQSENEKSAIDFLSLNEFDVCILDYYLPDGNGIDIIRKIKPQKNLSLYIIISNIVDEPLRKFILRSGADYFFDKSNEIDELFQLLEKLVREKKLKS